MASTAEMPEAPFDDEPGQQFMLHHQQVRGYVRYELTRRYLEPYLPATGSRTLDFGGGAGHDSIWLADQGYEVVLLDESNLLVEEAEANLASLPTEQNERVVALRGGTRELANQKDTYDLVLSHGVLMYAEDPRGQLKTLAQVTKRGGILSLLTKAMSGALEQAEREHRPDNVTRLKEAGVYLNHLGIKAHAYPRLVIVDMLKAAGFDVLEWNGVRTLPQTDKDRRKIWSVNPAEVERILKQEYEAGHTGHRKALAQMLHFVARKV